MEWQSDNELEKHELRARLRDKDQKAICARMGCDHQATDIHHIDGDHHNDAPENLAPSCKLCHNDVHGITAEMSDLKLLTRQFYEAQDQRKAEANRVRAYKALGIAVPLSEKALAEAEAYEEHLERYLRALLKHNSIYRYWLGRVKGIGPRYAASLIAEIGSIDRFPSVRSLWAYCGLHVDGEGKAPKRRRGQTANWNPKMRTTCWKIGGQFVKTKGSLGRQLYDKHKEQYVGRETSKAHVHNMAMRRAVKDFIRCLWVTWREMDGYELTIAQPGTQPFPEDWIVVESAVDAPVEQAKLG